nr:MAG TPA: portal protein [Caudoviricetes sp.]
MSSLISKDELPKNIQQKMTRNAKRTVRANSAEITIGNPTFYQPLFQSTNLLLPRDRRERNEWCRHFYRTEPIVATALDLHTEFPISDLNNVCSDPYIKKFFDYLAFEKLDMVNLLLEIGLEYWKLGDVFPFGQFNESEGLWEGFTLLNPDYVNVNASIFAKEQQIELIPDDQVTNIIAGGPSGQFGDLYRQFPEDIVIAVKQGKNISLDSRLVSHIAHKASPYESWGLPLMMRCFKTLIYKDKLRQAQDAIANRHIMPLRVAKIGTPGEPMPTQDDIDAFRDILAEGEDDPNFFLVYHYGLSFDYVGSTGKILPLNTEFDFIQNELMTGLGITQAMLNGDGSTYSTAQVGAEALARRYASYRLRLESWIRKKVYRPISEVQGFYKPKNGTIAMKNMSPREIRRAVSNKEMELIVPKLLWQQQDLTSNQTAMNFIQSLRDKGLVSMTTVLPLLSLDPETEKRNLENERGTVFDENAPKTGPLIQEGKPINNAFETGDTIRENAPQREDNIEDSATSRPTINTEKPTTGNNPEDFGLERKTSLDFDNVFTKRGDNKVTKRIKTKQD